MCVYTAAALGGTFKHVGVELLNLIGRGLPGEANWKFSTAESEQYLSQRTEAMMLGLSERDNTWITGFVNERGYGRFGYDLPTLWVQITSASSRTRTHQYHALLPLGVRDGRS